MGNTKKSIDLLGYILLTATVLGALTVWMWVVDTGGVGIFGGVPTPLRYLLQAAGMLLLVPRYIWARKHRSF